VNFSTDQFSNAYYSTILVILDQIQTQISRRRVFSKEFSRRDAASASLRNKSLSQRRQHSSSSRRTQADPVDAGPNDAEGPPSGRIRLRGDRPQSGCKTLESRFGASLFAGAETSSERELGRLAEIRENRGRGIEQSPKARRALDILVKHGFSRPPGRILCGSRDCRQSPTILQLG
jgi:hypothetical protein